MIQILGKKIREFVLSQRQAIGAPVDKFLPRTADAPLNDCRIPKAHSEYLGLRGHSSVVLLDRLSFSILLLGNPGIGKSTALKQCALRKLAARSHNTEKTVDFSHLKPLPIYLNLADYAGGLLDTIKASTIGLPYDDLVAAGKLSFLIDSYDQCPTSLTSTLESDVAEFLQTTGDCRVVIASCFDEGLEYFNGERFTLERLEKSFAEQTVADRSIAWPRSSDAVKNTMLVPEIFGEIESGRLIQNSGDLRVTSLLTQFVEHRMSGKFAVSDFGCWQFTVRSVLVWFPQCW